MGVGSRDLSKETTGESRDQSRECTHRLRGTPVPGDGPTLGRGSEVRAVGGVGVRSKLRKGPPVGDIDTETRGVEGEGGGWDDGGVDTGPESPTDGSRPTPSQRRKMNSWIHVDLVNRSCVSRRPGRPGSVVQSPSHPFPGSSGPGSGRERRDGSSKGRRTRSHLTVGEGGGRGHYSYSVRPGGRRRGYGGVGSTTDGTGVGPEESVDSPVVGKKTRWTEPGYPLLRPVVPSQFLGNLPVFGHPDDRPSVPTRDRNRGLLSE